MVDAFQTTCAYGSCVSARIICSIGVRVHAFAVPASFDEFAFSVEGAAHGAGNNCTWG